MYEEEIQRLEEELRNTKYNKHTQFHIGQLKAKIARLKSESEKKSGGKKGAGYSIKKSGDATVLLVGFPSVGKSTLLNNLTNAESKIGEYDFTTLDVIPGMMEYNGARIQILDIPGIIKGASKGKGRGREILSVMRNADLIVIMADRKNVETYKIIEEELYNAGFRLNKNPPDIVIHKKLTGGIDVNSTTKLTKINSDIIKSVLNEFKITSADVIIREDIGVDELIDVVMRNRVYVPCIRILNKCDELSDEERRKFEQNGWIAISAQSGANVNFLKKIIWKKLGLSRIYMKRIGKEPDMNEPLIFRGNVTVRDVARKIHKDAFGNRVEYAKIWGNSAKFPGQRVGPERLLQDGDIVELHVD